MENNKGGQIFYAVMGVATLIVTMIGATFAYFSATVSTANNALRATAANIELALNSQVTTGIKQNLIPVNETMAGFATGSYIGVSSNTTDPGQKNCVDDDGNTFCSVYTFTIENPSATTAQKVYARMDVIKNTFTSNATGTTECTNSTIYCNKSNFAFAIFKGTAADIDDNASVGWAVDDAAVDTYYGPSAASGVKMYDPDVLDNPTETEVDVTANTATSSGNVNGTAVLGKLGDLVVTRTPVPALTGNATHTFRLGALDQTLKPGGTVTYTVIMWLHENNQDQQNDESGQFAAGITFSTSLGGSGVTAVLASSGKL